MRNQLLFNMITNAERGSQNIYKIQQNLATYLEFCNK